MVAPIYMDFVMELLFVDMTLILEVWKGEPLLFHLSPWCEAGSRIQLQVGVEAGLILILEEARSFLRSRS